MHSIHYHLNTVHRFSVAASDVSRFDELSFVNSTDSNLRTTNPSHTLVWYIVILHTNASLTVSGYTRHSLKLQYDSCVVVELPITI